MAAAVTLNAGKHPTLLRAEGKMVGGSESLLVFAKGLLSAFVFLLPLVSYSSFHKTLLCLFSGNR